MDVTRRSVYLCFVVVFVVGYVKYGSFCRKSRVTKTMAMLIFAVSIIDWTAFRTFGHLPSLLLPGHGSRIPLQPTSRGPSHWSEWLVPQVIEPLAREDALLFAGALPNISYPGGTVSTNAGCLSGHWHCGIPAPTAKAKANTKMIKYPFFIEPI